MTANNKPSVLPLSISSTWNVTL